VAQLSRASQIGTTSSYLKTALASFSLVYLFLSLFHAAADFIDAVGLPPSPLALELSSSTSPKVMDHF
jgi:hypothetical protein